MQNQSMSTAIVAANNPVIEALFQYYDIDPKDKKRQHSHYSLFERVSFQLTALDLLDATLRMEKGEEVHKASKEYAIIRRETEAFEVLQDAFYPLHGIC